MFTQRETFEERVAHLLNANPLARAVFDRYSFQVGRSGQYPMVRVFGSQAVHDVHTLPCDDETAERVAALVRQHNGRRENDARDFVTLSSAFARIGRAVQVIENSGRSELLITIANPREMAIGGLRVTVAAPALRRFHGGFIGIVFRPRHASDSFDFGTEENDTLAQVELDLLWPGQSVEITLGLEPLRRSEGGVVAQE